MAFIQRLKSIIPTSIAKNLSGYEIRLDFTNKGPEGKDYLVNKSKKQVVIFVKGLTSLRADSLKKAIIDCFHKENAQFVEVSKHDLLDRLYKYNDNGDNQILNFFKPPILAQLDWEALRDSLFLRNEFKHHHPINSLKQDIILRYGERGNTISNLCTAGYFEETMIPLYNSDPKEFWTYYDLALNKGITALFVNHSMTIDKVGDEIKRRLESGKLYGLKYIHIHGIGDENIKKIKTCIEKYKSILGYTQKNVFFDDKLHVIVIEIIL